MTKNNTNQTTKGFFYELYTNTTGSFFNTTAGLFNLYTNAVNTITAMNLTPQRVFMNVKNITNSAVKLKTNSTVKLKTSQQ